MIIERRPGIARGFPLNQGVGFPIGWTPNPGQLFDKGLALYAYERPPAALEYIRVNHPGDYERAMLARAELRRREAMEAA